MKVLTQLTASRGIDVASTAVDTIKLGSANTENNDASVDNLTVWANADFKNNVTLGSSAADNTLVNSKLTASNSLYVSGSLIVNGVEITGSSSGNNGGFTLTISEISGVTKTNEVTNVSAIRFDKNTGFNVANLGSGEVEVSLGSTFKTWNISGQNSLVAVGEDTIELIAGNGIGLTTNTSSNPKSLTIAYTGSTGATSQQITSALSPYALSTSVSSSFTTPAQITSSLNNYAKSADVSSSFVSFTNATASLARLASINTFTTNQIISGNLNISSSLTSSEISSSNRTLTTTLGVGQTSPNANAPNAKLFVNGEIAIGSSATVSIKGNSNYVAFGHQAGGSNTNSIIAIGKNALSSSTGGYNVAVGVDTLVTSSGANNIAIGLSSLNANTTGIGNTSIGYQPMLYNTTGDYNIANGYWALQNNTTGDYNIAIGFQSLYGNVTGSYNTAIGHTAGNTLSSGSYNVFIGKYTGVTNSEKSVYISDNAGNLKLSANSAGLITAQGALTVLGNTILGDASGDIITTSGSLSVLNNIKFPSIQVASADANTLDDYEEGTWTPAFNGSTTSNFSYQVNGQVGNYTKIGRLVTATGYLFLSSTGSSTGNLRISGLPFTSIAGGASGGSYTYNATGLAAAITNTPNAVVLPSNTLIGLYKGAAGGSTVMNVTDISNSGLISFTAVYYTT
jgi:hypothetical protein